MLNRNLQLYGPGPVRKMPPLSGLVRCFSAVEPNRNPQLYGPGPVRRMGKRFATMPPLAGLVKCIGEATLLGILGGYIWYATVKEPYERGVREYYENQAKK